MQKTVTSSVNDPGWMSLWGSRVTVLIRQRWPIFGNLDHLHWDWWGGTGGPETPAYEAPLGSQLHRCHLSPS